MKNKTLLVLAVLLLAAFALTLVLERDPGPAGGDLTGQRLLPGLESALNDVAGFTVDAGGDEQATVRRGETGWVVVERSDFPADAGLIRRLLIRLAEARVLEPKTRNPDLYARLGVGDVGSDGGGVQLTLQGLPEPVSVIVGNRETRAGTGTYLRLAGDEQSYLVDAELDPARTPQGWLDRELFDIEADDVQTIDVRQDDGATLRIERGEDGLAVADVPADRSLSSDTAPRTMAGVLRALELDDVRPSADFADEPPAAVAEYALEDGRRVTAKLWQRDDGRYAAFRVAYAAPAADAEAPDPVTEAEAETTGETGAAAPADEAAAAAALDARLTPWVFRIPAHKYDLMARRMDDLLAAPALE